MSWNRVLSGLLAAAYIVVAFFTGDAKGAFILGMFVVLPLACVWFSESMGGYLGPASGAAITQTTPSLIVCIAGWLLLLLPIAVLVISSLNS